MQKYYLSNPYRVDINSTIRENTSFIDTYINTYKMLPRRQHIVDFALRYLLVKTSIDRNSHPKPKWIVNFLNHHLTADRPILDIRSLNTIYYPISKKPDRVFMYLRDREISNVSFLCVSKQ